MTCINVIFDPLTILSEPWAQQRISGDISSELLLSESPQESFRLLKIGKTSSRLDLNKRITLPLTSYHCCLMMCALCINTGTALVFYCWYFYKIFVQLSVGILQHRAIPACLFLDSLMKSVFWCFLAVCRLIKSSLFIFSAHFFQACLFQWPSVSTNVWHWRLIWGFSNTLL